MTEPHDDPRRDDTTGEHIFRCPVCGQLVDMRSPRQVIWHEQKRHKPLDNQKAD